MLFNLDTNTLYKHNSIWSAIEMAMKNKHTEEEIQPWDDSASSIEKQNVY